MPSVRTRVLIPSGVLGLGFDAEALAAGVAAKPDIIAIDGGSTDSGPFYLGTGVSKYSRAACKSEWRQLMQARADAGVPLVIGSCGTCGTDATVEWMYDLTVELAAELGQSIKVALIFSSQPAAFVASRLHADKVVALEPVAPSPLTADDVDAAANIVALAGVEQINAALATGADIVLAGRATDTAAIAALPIARGAPPGCAWHAAKIAECGALCSTHPTSGVVMVEVDESGFTVEPMATTATCTPYSVSSHMLYENADPFHLYEPGGMLDVSQAEYVALDDRRVRVTGSAWVSAADYTVKLEAARCVGYQATLIATLREAHYVENAQAWVDRLTGFLRHEIASRMGLADNAYALEFRLMGVNSVLGALEARRATPVEVGVLALITAADADTAEEIALLINPFMLHYPLTDHEELPTFAFPYSPAHSMRGAVYEFCVNHIMVLDDPMQAFRLETRDVNASPAVKVNSTQDNPHAAG